MNILLWYGPPLCFLIFHITSLNISAGHPLSMSVLLCITFSWRLYRKYTHPQGMSRTNLGLHQFVLVKKNGCNYLTREIILVCTRKPFFKLHSIVRTNTYIGIENFLKQRAILRDKIANSTTQQASVQASNTNTILTINMNTSTW